MKYQVTLLYDASEVVEVEADSVEQAIDKAHMGARASLCNYCAQNLELGDAFKEIVCDEDGNEIEEPE